MKSLQSVGWRAVKSSNSLLCSITKFEPYEISDIYSISTFWIVLGTLFNSLTWVSCPSPAPTQLHLIFFALKIPKKIQRLQRGFCFRLQRWLLQSISTRSDEFCVISLYFPTGKCTNASIMTNVYVCRV